MFDTTNSKDPNDEMTDISSSIARILELKPRKLKPFCKKKLSFSYQTFKIDQNSLSPCYIKCLN